MGVHAAIDRQFIRLLDRVNVTHSLLSSHSLLL